ncbi:hypothetical protein G3I60_40940 [Streptomyces sp. SID13666]|uniref:hypothetical protein n=1 Tax=unclassified Streptomyces TaxID=2593676 RepID=UPI0013BF09E4|nr:MULTISPECIES: hypothetical protein [unclassified Streptomyces]NEA60366.1 hypothetical protein [Streptomyces sp. SID13666]NEA76772.1 hypothetical protein [Streptomyces sp. SID13588]
MPDLAALDCLLQRARAVRVSDVVHPAEPAILTDLMEPADLSRLRRAMAVSSLPGGICMCRGDIRFDFLDSHGQQIATVGFHHGVTLRWTGWEGNTVLVDGQALLYWLNDHQAPRALEQFEEDKRQRSRALAVQASWTAAMPAALSGLALRILALSSTGESPSAELLSEAHTLLGHGLREPTPRVLALLAWHGSGTGRYSGYPVHEAFPGLLLSDVPITVIITALQDSQADERHDTGAVRHLLGWKSRNEQARDIDTIPASLRARLLHQARTSDDTTIRRRAEQLLTPTRE